MSDLVKVDATLGKQLIEAAQERRRQRFSDNVVQAVDSIYEAIACNEKRLAAFNKVQEQLKKQLAAIEAGEFTVGSRGEILFNDRDLHNPMPMTLVERGDSMLEAFFDGIKKRNL